MQCRRCRRNYVFLAAAANVPSPQVHGAPRNKLSCVQRPQRPAPGSLTRQASALQLLRLLRRLQRSEQAAARRGGCAGGPQHGLRVLQEMGGLPGGGGHAVLRQARQAGGAAGAPTLVGPRAAACAEAVRRRRGARRCASPGEGRGGGCQHGRGGAGGDRGGAGAARVKPRGAMAGPGRQRVLRLLQPGLRRRGPRPRHGCRSGGGAAKVEGGRRAAVGRRAKRVQPGGRLPGRQAARLLRDACTMLCCPLRSRQPKPTLQQPLPLPQRGVLGSRVRPAAGLAGRSCGGSAQVCRQTSGERTGHIGGSPGGGSGSRQGAVMLGNRAEGAWGGVLWRSQRGGDDVRSLAAAHGEHRCCHAALEVRRGKGAHARRCVAEQAGGAWALLSRGGLKARVRPARG